MFLTLCPRSSCAQHDPFGCRITNTPDPLTGRYEAAKLWPDGIIPYQFMLDQSSFYYVSPENQQKTVAAMETIEAVCDVDFVPRSGEPDYVLIRNDTGNSAWVGRKGGEQFLGMLTWDAHYAIVHELMHCGGAWHEMQRPDRGTYVTINWNNIPDNQENNFVLKGDTTIGRYDFDSVMHYRRFHWTGNGLPTIEPKPGYERWKYRMGQITHLSAGDILLLAAMYGGPRPPGGFDLTSPPDGAAVGAGWTPLFEWSAAELASSYRLLVDDDRDFASPEMDVELSDTLHFGGSLESNRLFYWTVIASNGDGDTGPSFAPITTLYTGSSIPPVLYVDDSAPAGGGGGSWDAPINDLQLALDFAASSGGSPVEIRVAQGVYTPGRDSRERFDSFVLRSNFTVRGGYAGYGSPDPHARDIHAYPTILSGDLASDDGADFANTSENSVHVIWLAGQRTGPVTLDGITVSAGNADGAFLPTGLGGGIWADDCDIRLRDCAFTGSQATVNGAGVFLQACDGLIDRCTFEGNRVNAHPSGLIGGNGGALAATFGWGATSLERCSLESNQARLGGGAFFRWSAAEFTDCDIAENDANVHGGGVFALTSDATLNSCRLVGNVAGEGYGGGFVGARGASVSLVNCLLFDNSAVIAGGGGEAETGAAVTLTNCTVSQNSAPDAGGLYVTDEFGDNLHTTAAISNSVVAGNEGGDVSEVAGATVIASYSNVQGGWDGTGNIDEDPLFSDATAGDYSLSSFSACIDAADNTALPGGLLTDLAGNPRFHNDPWTEYTGVEGGEGGEWVVDMGALEFQGSSCYADFNSDLAVDTRDVLAFLNAWNAQDSTSDCDGNGVIDTRDVICFLNLWTSGC